MRPFEQTLLQENPTQETQHRRDGRRFFFDKRSRFADVVGIPDIRAIKERDDVAALKEGRFLIENLEEKKPGGIRKMKACASGEKDTETKKKREKKKNK